MSQGIQARSLYRLVGAAGVVLLLGLGACANQTALDQLADAQPTGSAFSRALFKNYAYLAHSFGDVGAAAGTSFDQEGSLSLAEMDSNVGALAEAYAAKALLAAQDADVGTEPATDPDSHQMRNRLVKALGDGRDKFPADAARAQVDYDCWMLNSTVASMARAAAQCRRSLDSSLRQLERDINPAPVAEVSPAPSPVDYTTYFDFNSWSLTAEDLGLLQQAVATARAGRQSRIAVVGHTDTSGSADYNQHLSVRRAGVVKDVLTQMGARSEAVDASGVGETDLAVQTADGVPEPRNRRAVVTLQP